MPARGLLLAAWDELSTHRGRSALSMLSVVIGIAALTLVVAAGDIGRRTVLAQIERTAGRPVTITLSLQPGSAVDASAVRDFIEQRLRRYGIEETSALDRYDVVASMGPLTSRVELLGVSAPMANIRRLDVMSGRWLERDDESRLAPVIVCNVVCAAELSIAPADSGQRLTIEVAGAVFDVPVVGIVDDGLQTGTAYAPAQQSGRELPRPGN